MIRKHSIRKDATESHKLRLTKYFLKLLVVIKPEAKLSRIPIHPVLISTRMGSHGAADFFLWDKQRKKAGVP